MTFLKVLSGSVVPDIEVAIDFANDPTSGTTTWTDVTPYLVAYSRQPVRQNEFDQPTGATAALLLRNDDARFIPDNASGPYYGKLKKLRRCRVRAQWAGVTYNRFWGYIEDWPQTWDQAGRDQNVQLRLSDGFKPLETYDLQGQAFAGTLTGAALADVLTAAGITAQSLDTGASTIPDSGTLSPQSYALQRVHDISATENGVCYANGGGTIVFNDREHRIYAGTVAAAGTIGDAAGEIPYLNPQPMYGDAWPIVNVSPAGGSIQTWTVDAGTASFFQQTLNFPTAGQYLVSSEAEALAAAQYLAERYASPLTRLAGVDLIGARAPTLWPTILGLDTSTRVLFRRRFLSGGTVGGTIEIDGFVEGYGDTVEVGHDWRVNVPISPRNPQLFWILGVPGYSELGLTTVPGY